MHLPCGREAQHHLELTDRNQHGRSGDETRDHGMAQKAGQETQAQQAHDHQHGTRKKGQCDGHGRVVGRADGRMLTNRCGRHERDHRHRAHRQHATGSKNRVQQQRRNAGVQPHLGWQTRQSGISQALGNEHDGDDQCRHQITDQRVTLVVTGPVQHGQGRGQSANRHIKQRARPGDPSDQATRTPPCLRSWPPQRQRPWADPRPC